MKLKLDGRKTICSGEHLWVASYYYQKNKVYKTKDMYNKYYVER